MLSCSFFQVLMDQHTMQKKKKNSPAPHTFWLTITQTQGSWVTFEHFLGYAHHHMIVVLRNPYGMCVHMGIANVARITYYGVPLCGKDRQYCVHHTRNTCAANVAIEWFTYSDVWENKCSGTIVKQKIVGPNL